MSDQYKVIGLTGRSGSGKTEVAGMLVKSFNFMRMSFGDKLKETAGSIYSLSTDQLYGDKKEDVDERYGLSPRFILQTLGTEVCREIHPQTWVMALERRIRRLDAGALIVVDDVRFDNEALAVRSWGGVVWRVDREEVDELVVGRQGHASEVPLGYDVDAVLDNNGTLDELKRVIWHALRDWEKWEL